MLRHLQICAVGWEPNPGLTDYLTKLESHLRGCGHRVIINTEVGVGVANSVEKFIRLKQVRLRILTSQIKCLEFFSQDPLLYNSFPMEMASQFVSEQDIQVNSLSNIQQS